MSKRALELRWRADKSANDRSRAIDDDATLTSPGDGECCAQRMMNVTVPARMRERQRHQAARMMSRASGAARAR